MSENEPISLILGIFVGMAATLSLQSFLPLQINLWIAYSAAVMGISIFFIYFIIHTDKTQNWFNETIRIISVAIVTFLPFSFQKLSEEYNLPFWGLMIHIALVGITIFILGWTNKNDSDKSKALLSKWIGGIIALIAIFLVITKPEGFT